MLSYILSYPELHRPSMQDITLLSQHHPFSCCLTSLTIKDLLDDLVTAMWSMCTTLLPELWQ